MLAFAVFPSEKTLNLLQKWIQTPLDPFEDQALLLLGSNDLVLEIKNGENIGCCLIKNKLPLVVFICQVSNK